MFAFVDGQYLALGGHHLHLQHLVDAETTARAQQGVAAAREVPAHADGGSAASHDGAVVLVEGFVQVPHLLPSTDGHRPAVDVDVAAARLERIVHLHPLQVMGPYGEGVGCCGPPEVVVPRALHNEPDVMFSRWPPISFGE